MKIRTSLMLDETLLKKLKKTAVDGNKNYSDMLNLILSDYFSKNINKLAERKA